MKEVILEDTDISKALLDYISKNLINSIVLGAATRSGISRLINTSSFLIPPS